MNLQKRIELLGFLGEYLKEDSASYQELRYRAFMENKWFTPEYVFQSGKLIADHMLNKDQLSSFAATYGVREGLKNKTIGLVMAGNIPYVGFHDLLCIFFLGSGSGSNLLQKTVS